MANPFSNIPQGKNVVRQNNWDWSHDNHLTTKLGAITPVFCQKVPPKTSLSINPRFGLKFMPMVFPVQNNIKARISFFKVPLRALWTDYQNWISSVNTEQHSKYVPPYIYLPSDSSPVWGKADFEQLFGRGSLADYLGLPTDSDSVMSNTLNATSLGSMGSSGLCLGTASHSSVNLVYFNEQQTTSLIEYCRSVPSSTVVNLFFHTMSGQTSDGMMMVFMKDSLAINTCTPIDDISSGAVTFTSHDDVEHLHSITAGSILATFNGVQGAKTIVIIGAFMQDGSSPSFQIPVLGAPAFPWASDAVPDGLKLSSYPWRAYNAIYNAYYRNIRNNPLKSYVDGTPLYNDYVLPYKYGGSEYVVAQKTDISSSQNLPQYWADFYGLRYANWQLDAFTSAVASPQQGNAPLVGLTNTATVVTNSDGTETATLNSYLTDEDGKTYKVLYNTDKEGLRSVEYLEQPIDGQIMPTAYAAVSQGISIADLRNVNAYTRYLELNMRRGYRYKDIVEGRFDVNVRYDELLMPEFCGGFTRSFDISPITQTVQTVPDGTTYSGALGSQAGDGICFGASDNRIKIYCDEESIVMGLLTVTPEPIYSQILPKFFLDRDVLDSFNPEFNALGFQPVSNAEVAPIQAFKNGGMAAVNKTFGYQRPWYNLVRLPNVAHGDFRGWTLDIGCFFCGVDTTFYRELVATFTAYTQLEACVYF